MGEYVDYRPDGDAHVFDCLIGKTISAISRGGNELIFTFSDNSAVCMKPEKSFRYCVTIEDIDTDINDLIGDPITMFEANYSWRTLDEVGKDYGCYMYAFYRIGTSKSTAVIRWYSKNGPYSEPVAVEWAD